jgi:DNA modification methylase
VARLVEVFSEVRRLLVDHGTLWLNLGDTYVEKQLLGVPWRVALALQDDGWFLRSDIIWKKANAMPSSTTDRPTVDHEYVFLLAKNRSYYFDQEAVREDFQNERVWGNRWFSMGRAPEATETLGDLPPEAPRGADGRRATKVKSREHSANFRDGERWPHARRNIRTVWEIPTQNYQGAHFAVFPEELARRAILAGSPERVCRVCAVPSTRIVEVGDLAGEGRIADGARPAADERGVKPGSLLRSNGHTWRERRDLGWTDCGHDAYRPGVVLDPFHGTGTTSFVARNHGRHALGIELNESYLEMARERLQQLSLLT